MRKFSLYPMTYTKCSPSFAIIYTILLVYPFSFSFDSYHFNMDGTDWRPISKHELQSNLQHLLPLETLMNSKIGLIDEKEFQKQQTWRYCHFQAYGLKPFG